MHRDAVAEPAQVIGCRHAGRTSADDQNMLAGFGSPVPPSVPAAFERLVAEGSARPN